MTLTVENNRLNFNVHSGEISTWWLCSTIMAKPFIIHSKCNNIAALIHTRLKRLTFRMLLMY